MRAVSKVGHFLLRAVPEVSHFLLTVVSEADNFHLDGHKKKLKQRPTFVKNSKKGESDTDFLQLIFRFSCPDSVSF